MYRKKIFHIPSKKGHWRCSPNFGVTKNQSKLTVCLSHQSVSIRCHPIVPDRDLRSNVLVTTLERSSTGCFHSLSVHEPLVSQHTLAWLTSASVHGLRSFFAFRPRGYWDEGEKNAQVGGRGRGEEREGHRGFPLSPPFALSARSNSKPHKPHGNVCCEGRAYIGR